jgi:hypothetical protein
VTEVTTRIFLSRQADSASLDDAELKAMPAMPAWLFAAAPIEVLDVCERC